MTLCELSINELAQVSQITLEDQKVLTRLAELGISAGRDITCLRKTPFGGPSIFRTSDSVFSLERSLADSVEISLNGNNQ